MFGLLKLASAAVAAVVLLYTWRYYSLNARRRQMRVKHGCKEPTWYPHTDRVRGSDLTALRKQAIRDGRLKMLFLEHFRTLGETWQEKVDGEVKVYTIRSENIRCIFASRLQDFGFSLTPGTPVERLFGARAFFGSLEEHKRTRKLILPTFTKYENGVMPMLRGHVDTFVDGLPRDGRAFDIQPPLKRLFVDLATDFLFDLPLGMQHPEKRQDAEKFLADFDAVLLGLNKRRMGFTFSAFFKFLFDRSYAQGVNKIHAFIDNMVQAAIDRSSPREVTKSSLSENSETVSKPGRYILVDELVKLTQDRLLLRSAMLQAFVPARLNSAIFVSNTIWALSRHPEYWTRLRPIALELTEDETISFPKLVSLAPIRHVIFEGVRLCGPGGLNGRVVKTDLVLPKGGGPDGESPLFVAAGTRILVHPPVMHRSKRYWGDDADEYRPERFQGRDIAQDWEFMPFLAGPKACPAKHQVIVQATYILVRLLREFESIKCTDEVERFVEEVKLTTESRRGCQIALIPANK